MVKAYLLYLVMNFGNGVYENTVFYGIPWAENQPTYETLELCQEVGRRAEAKMIGELEHRGEQDVVSVKPVCVETYFPKAISL